jgi:ribulose-5-phosphate 4-epimerase/fuculose-1-phosphate aldolase
LSARHYTRVLKTCPEENMVLCEGPIRASSESMTHGAIYGVLPEVGAVIHIHNRRLWDTLINHVPTTPEETAYGTPALCAEVTKLLSVATAAAEGVIVMAGHIEGLFVFGRTLDEAGSRLLGLVARG